MPLTGKRLLVLSADGELARLVADASSCHGASLVPCSGGQAALDEADAHGADAVIVDLPVADFRPDALLIALRRRGLKTVAVSGVLPAARYAATALRFGAEAFLEKPVDVQEVLAALSRALLPAAAGPAQTATPDPAPALPALIENPTEIPIPSPAPSPGPTPAASTAAAEPPQSRDCSLDRDERGQRFAAEPPQSRDCSLDRDERGQGSFPALTPFPFLTPVPFSFPALTPFPFLTPIPVPVPGLTPIPAATPIPALTPPSPSPTSAPLLIPTSSPSSAEPPQPRAPASTASAEPPQPRAPASTASAEPPQPRAPAPDRDEARSGVHRDEARSGVHRDHTRSGVHRDEARSGVGPDETRPELLREQPGQGPTVSAEPWIEAEPSADYPVPGDLDSCVFSEAQPALEDTPPGITGAPDPRVGLAAPLPTASVPAVRKPGSPTLPEGDLALTGVPCVLAALHAARTTGALTLVQPPARKLVLLEDGHPVFAASNVPSERFAARCVREGILGAEAIEVLAALIGPKEPLNEALLARGLLDEARRSRMFGEQIREILWSTFEWRTGEYRLLTGPRARRPIARVRIHAGDLILEGFRRTSTIERLHEDLPAGLALARATAAPFELEELPMSEPEALMLSLADGTKTISDLVLLSAMDERSALAFLAGCRAIGILDEVRRALAGTRRIGFM